MRKRQLVGLPLVSGYPTFLFAQVVWAVSFIRFYESNTNITHSIGISKKRNTKVTRKRQFSRTTVCKRLSDFFVCTSRMSGIVHTILRIERKHLALYNAIKVNSNANITCKRQLVGLPFVSGYPTFLFAQIVWAVSFIRLYESNAVKNKKTLLSCRVVRYSLITTYVIQCDFFNI